MRRQLWWPLSVLLLAGLAARARIPNSSQSGQPPGGPPAESVTPAETREAPKADQTPVAGQATKAGQAPEADQAPTTPAIKPGVTVRGKTPPAALPLPALPPDEFKDCVMQGGGRLGLELCGYQLAREKQIVLDACTNRFGNSAPPRIIQACTKLLERRVFDRWMRFYWVANRAAAYLAEGDKQHALDDLNAAVKLAPRHAELYYNRGVFYAGQSNDDAALRDFDKAIGIDRKLVPALRQRAKIYQARGNLSEARADYSEAIGLQPKTAALWSERGYVYLRQHDYESAMRDEAQAIQLDPKLARAYFLRAAAFGDLGDSRNASSDIKTAVDLDPSLARYVMIKGKTASLALPP